MSKKSKLIYPPKKAKLVYPVLMENLTFEVGENIDFLDFEIAIYIRGIQEEFLSINFDSFEVFEAMEDLGYDMAKTYCSFHVEEEDGSYIDMWDLIHEVFTCEQSQELAEMILYNKFAQFGLADKFNIKNPKHED